MSSETRQECQGSDLEEVEARNECWFSFNYDFIFNPVYLLARSFCYLLLYEGCPCRKFSRKGYFSFLVDEATICTIGNVLQQVNSNHITYYPLLLSKDWEFSFYHTFLVASDFDWMPRFVLFHGMPARQEEQEAQREARCIMWSEVHHVAGAGFSIG